MANGNNKKNYSNNSKSQGYKKNSYKPRKQEGKYDKKNGASEKVDKDTSSYVGSENDPKWYTKNTRLIQDAAKIPFSNQLGTNLTWDVAYRPTGAATMATEAIPGIYALEMVNVPGIATSATDGVNIATAGLFQYIRRNLSTVATYAPADVMAVVLAIDEVYSMYANITRVFGIINAYSAINLYLPQKLLQAAYGFNETEITNIIANINDYRSRFNNLIFKASTLYLPTDFSVTARHAWLYSNYFTDEPSVKAQIYVHRMAMHHVFDEVKYTTGSALVATTNATTLSGLLNQFNMMVDLLRNSDSALKIQADMRRAFEDRSSWKLAYVDEAYMVLPQYSEEVLLQIHNTSILPRDFRNNSRLDITQNVDHNILVFNPKLPMATVGIDLRTDAEIMYQCSTRLLDAKMNDVTSDDICEMTRNSTVCTVSNDATNTTLEIWRCGVDICIGASIWSRTRAVTVRQALVNADGLTTTGAICDISKFDWSPIVYVNSYNINDFQPLSDLANYTLVDPALLARLHDNILCSMWSIPEIGTITGM